MPLGCVAKHLHLGSFSYFPASSRIFTEIGDIIEGDPYLADYRKDVVLEALRHEGLCGDAARDSVGTISTEYCSEFVREVYMAAEVDGGLCGRRACLGAVTYAKQLRRIFQGNGSWVYASDADTLTAEPGDYLSMDDQDHSALVVATSIDGRHLWRVGGNEGAADCDCQPTMKKRAQKKSSHSMGTL